ncbi:MAG: hypothetical protein GXX81_12455 [Acidobacteria bacterium]|jgi:hypothetical protein|nr:hypothetical protein [Acidobacteriota bacterium]
MLRTCSPSGGDARVQRCVFLAGLAVGVLFFAFYYSRGLTLAHYDAKAHLLVARRIVDSLEPGYSQMGGQWLPLVHLLYLPFVIFDAQYRSGLLPSLISVLCFAVSGALVYRISLRITGSGTAALCSAVLLIANPNLLYLQSCPLTEPVFMALFLLALDRLLEWRASDHSRLPWAAAVWTALAGMCRYEGWGLLLGIVALLLADGWTRRVPRPQAVRAAAVSAAVFALPALAHFGYILVRLGDVFFSRVAAGAPTPYLTHRRPFLSLLYHLAQVEQMATLLPLVLAGVGILVFLRERERRWERAPLLLLWVPSLVNIAALYWGHVYRLRYSVLLLPAVAVCAGLAIRSEKARRRALPLLFLLLAVLPWVSWATYVRDPQRMLVPGPGAAVLPVLGLGLYAVARLRGGYARALLLLCVAGMVVPPLARERLPMMAETLEHEFIEPERDEILQYLRRHYDGGRILVDMGRQAPLVYDSGLRVSEFVYNDGEGRWWHRALADPVRVVGWLCAQKGDAVWERIMMDPRIRTHYTVAVDTEHLALYRLKVPTGKVERYP